MPARPPLGRRSAADFAHTARYSLCCRNGRAASCDSCQERQMAAPHRKLLLEKLEPDFPPALAHLLPMLVSTIHSHFNTILLAAMGVAAKLNRSPSWRTHRRSTSRQGPATRCSSALLPARPVVHPSDDEAGSGLSGGSRSTAAQARQRTNEIRGSDLHKPKHCRNSPIAMVHQRVTYIVAVAHHRIALLMTQSEGSMQHTAQP